MKIAFLSVVAGLLLGVTASADQKVLPVMDGYPAKVLSVRLEAQPQTNSSKILATVSYNGICSAPNAFVAVRQGNKISLLEAKIPTTGVSCMAISVVTAEIEVGSVFGPAQAITVNGVELK